MRRKTYIAIDLKSFYASVECVDRGLDPLTTNLVVADNSRTEKTICLAVTPALKSFGIPGRARLFEVVQKVKDVNLERGREIKGDFTGKSFDINELSDNKSLAVSYIVAPPRMAHYIEISTKVYQVYLKYVAPEDIHVYSIDEVFIDATPYLKTNGLTGAEFARKIISDVLETTGITATAGIGTNLYLSKIDMDIVAKHIPADKYGVRIAELDEMSYKEKLWDHKPLTDFWRVGPGISRRLHEKGLYTMGDVARCSLECEDLLFGMFGKNAELLIDHAWGCEPCTIKDIKAYKPENNSIGSGQVLQSPYTFEKARIVVNEMLDMLSLDLVDKGLVTNQIVIDVGYDIENKEYKGERNRDYYGRSVPKPAHGSINLGKMTSSSKVITTKGLELFDGITNKELFVRRLTVTFTHVVPEGTVNEETPFCQMDFFTDYENLEKEKLQEQELLEKEKNMQKAVINIQKKFGKNAVLKGMSLQEGATGKERNKQIGGHKA